MSYILYRILATLSFFTRLPFWRLANVPKECYERVVPLWPMTGWLTGSIMGFVYYICCCVFTVVGSPFLCVAFTFMSRVLITGALHEDGFADFCDGFGGSSSRERILEIMKDSRIGTYGVLSLIFYFLILLSVVSSIGHLYECTYFVPSVLLVADVMCKAVSSTIIYSLPYARNVSDAKNKLVYSNSTLGDKCATVILSLVPCSVLVLLVIPYMASALVFAFLMIIVARSLLVRYMRNRIHGYTGDCCGAMFVICECTFYISVAIWPFVNKNVTELLT